MLIELFGEFLPELSRCEFNFTSADFFFFFSPCFPQMTSSPKMALSLLTVFCVKQMKVFDIRTYLGFVFAHEGSTALQWDFEW